MIRRWGDQIVHRTIRRSSHCNILKIVGITVTKILDFISKILSSKQVMQSFFNICSKECYLLSSLKGITFFYLLKFIYSEKATQFCELFTLLLSVCTADKIKMKISQNFVAFSEYMNFNPNWHEL